MARKPNINPYLLWRRDQFIVDILPELKDIGASMQELADVMNLTRQQVYNISKKFKKRKE